ncbi:hypothetical protein E0Z10_g7960 [Xylaria hypoxylon]|uniref:SnoaL-like domain-containing protein n=1 Tax=Xylaria hypoxylon TaxID=37992 RepID=A0A4Z0YTL3_9PEZI|nr:hypothetical protein E0Z10_g7960 [Xylaria hypoxylon]
MASSTEDLRATIESTVTQFLSGPARALAANDASVYLAALTEDCEHHLRPLAFVAANPPLKSVKSNEEQKAQLEAAFVTTEEFKHVNIRELVIDLEKRKASVLAEHHTKIIGAEANTLEITWFFDFTEDGKRISRVSEFIDTATAEKRLADMKRQGFLTNKG